ncbi:MAG: GNAT family N-acetyltransferase [Alphaproteobacteria bacterium]|jgi:predicted GNAT family acetyltransferase
MPDIAGFRNNVERQRFELTEHELTAFADYRCNGSELAILHVEAPVPLRGKGTAERLMHGIASHARQHRLTIMPLCGYARAWLRRHRKWNDLLADGSR